MDNMDRKTHEILTCIQYFIWLLCYVALLIPFDSFLSPAIIMLTLIVFLNTWSHKKYYTHQKVDKKAKIVLVINMILIFILLIYDNSTFELLFILILVGDAIFGMDIQFSLIYTLITFAVAIPYYTYSYDSFFMNQQDISVLRDLIIALVIVPIMYLTRWAIRNAVENKTLLVTKKAAYDKLSHYTAKMEVMAAEEERNRIALILHNSIGHSLISIMLSLQAEKRERIERGELPEDAFQSLEQQIKEAMALLRKMVSNTDDFFVNISFHQLMQLFISSASNNTRMSIRYIDKNTGHIPRAYNGIVFNLVQEAVNNAMKHSGGNRIEINIICHTEQMAIELKVRDNGKGETDIVYGFGMTKSKELVESTGGTYKICNDNGFVVMARIPIKR